MTGLRIIAGSRETGTRRHPRSELRWFIVDENDRTVSDHATLEDAERAAGISPQPLSRAEIGAAAGLAFQVYQRFGNALFGKPEGVGIFKWLGERAAAGDETAIRAGAWLRAEREKLEASR